MTKTHLRAFVPLMSLCLLGVAGEVSAQATDVACLKCVDTSDIAPAAVTPGKLGPQSVTSSKIR